MIYPMNNGEKPADHLTIGFPCQPGDRFENRNAITKKGGKGGKGGLVDQPGVEDVGFWWYCTQHAYSYLRYPLVN